MIGFTELITIFNDLEAISESSRQEYLRILADRFLNELAKRAPVDTGEYIRSWRIKSQSQDMIVIGPSGTQRVGNQGKRSGGRQVSPLTNVQLAVILEFTGSQRHLIIPRKKKALKLPDGFRAYVVDHPGAKPQPHIRPALAQIKREAPAIAVAVLAGKVKDRIWRTGLTKKARDMGYAGPIPPKQTGRSSKDTSANIGRGTKGQFGPKLSVGLSGKRLRPRGITRLVGSSESGRKGITKIGGTARGQGLERYR